MGKRHPGVPGPGETLKKKNPPQATSGQTYEQHKDRKHLKKDENTCMICSSVKQDRKLKHAAGNGAARGLGLGSRTRGCSALSPVHRLKADCLCRHDPHTRILGECGRCLFPTSGWFGPWPGTLLGGCILERVPKCRCGAAWVPAAVVTPCAPVLQGGPPPGLPASGPDRDVRAPAAPPQRQAPDARHPQKE